MKQNERILVYAVTGFLAVILVIAVLFGRGANEPAAGSSKVGQAVPLADILGQKPTANPAGGPADPSKPANGSGLLPPGQVSPEQPLVAPSKTMVAADFVAQNLGPSRRDRHVRFVRARAGDSLETIVRRWCGTTDGYLDEARSYNEELVMVRLGQEVGVPWVDDEIVLAAFEARQPKKLAVEAGDGVANGGVTPAAGGPDFAQPGGGSVAGGTAEPKPFANGAGAPAPAMAAGTRTYVVKSGDSLWRIADRTYGRKNAERMVAEIRKLNPDVGERLREGQKIVLPAASSVVPGGA